MGKSYNLFSWEYFPVPKTPIGSFGYSVAKKATVERKKSEIKIEVKPKKKKNKSTEKSKKKGKR